MRLIESVKRILYMDSFVSQYKAEDERRSQQGIALIAAAAFGIMSLLNIKQRSYVMLATTSISGLFLIIGYFVSKFKNKVSLLKGVFYSISVVIFTAYTVEGGNEGFAALWLIIATYAVMIEIDFRAGFLISLYYLIMLLLVFIGPLTHVLQYDYNKTFMLRFPFLYAINFAFATYIAVCVRKYQYELLIKQQELERLSMVDLSTGLMNRNYFIKCKQTFFCHDLQALTAVFIDVNGLHEVNNREGHDAGDRMLCYIADLCKKYFDGQSIYRMGGDEFLVLCRNIGEREVLKAVHLLIDSVEQAGYSISYGIERQESDFDLDEIVKKADEKMIRYKKEYYECMNRKNR